MKLLATVLFCAIVISFAAASPLKAAKELRWQEVAGELMSPACPGKLVIDCPSGEGAQLRTLIKQKVDDGWTKKQIKEYFVGIYGEEYLAAPAKKGFYLLVWVLPFALLGVGAFVVFFVIKIWKKEGEVEERAASSVVGQENKRALSEKLDEELEKFDF